MLYANMDCYMQSPFYTCWRLGLYENSHLQSIFYIGWVPIHTSQYEYIYMYTYVCDIHLNGLFICTLKLWLLYGNILLLTWLRMCHSAFLACGRSRLTVHYEKIEYIHTYMYSCMYCLEIWMSDCDYYGHFH